MVRNLKLVTTSDFLKPTSRMILVKSDHVMTLATWKRRVSMRNKLNRKGSKSYRNKYGWKFKGSKRPRRENKQSRTKVSSRYSRSRRRKDNRGSQRIQKNYLRRWNNNTKQSKNWKTTSRSSWLTQKHCRPNSSQRWKLRLKRTENGKCRCLRTSPD